MIISVKPCENCGNSNKNEYKEYDGALGYEAIICRKCGWIYDYTGSHEADEFSKQYITRRIEK